MTQYVNIVNIVSWSLSKRHGSVHIYALHPLLVPLRRDWIPWGKGITGWIPLPNREILEPL